MAAIVLIGDLVVSGGSGGSSDGRGSTGRGGGTEWR